MRPDKRDEIHVIRDELERLRAEVDAVRIAGGRPRWTRAVRPRIAKRLARIGLVALMLALPVMVSASHQFTDVPDSHTFHAAISKLEGAALTSGCTTTQFCPDANVTRGQMAAFLSRGLGRGALGVGSTGLADDWAAFDTSLAAVWLVPGGAMGGTGHVLVTATVSAYTSLAGTCPCELTVWLANGANGEPSAKAYQIISDVPGPPDDAGTSWYETSASMSYLFGVQSGIRNAYILGASMHPTTAPTGDVAGAEWSMTAVYIPFGATGGNPTIPTGKEEYENFRKKAGEPER